MILYDFVDLYGLSVSLVSGSSEVAFLTELAYWTFFTCISPVVFFLSVYSPHCSPKFQLHSFLIHFYLPNSTLTRVCTCSVLLEAIPGPLCSYATHIRMFR